MQKPAPVTSSSEETTGSVFLPSLLFMKGWAGSECFNGTLIMTSGTRKTGAGRTAPLSRSLLESGALKGEDLVQIGIRDYSNAKEYGDYCARQGVTVYTMADVEAGDITSIVKKEIQRLKQQVDVIYLSVDMDVVDQAFAPGCPAIGPGGLTSRELLLSVQAASCDPIVKAMDIVEVDPSKDFRDMTSRLAAHVMMRYMFQ